jgi:pimeloyl-ACP methyl ester carboxylesterase
MDDQRSATTGDGRRLTYAVVGKGPVLVCHPGGPGMDGSYFEDLGGLADVRTLVLVHPAGTAGSDPWPEDAYSLARAADDVDELRATLGEERIDYLGHSAGGFVGQRYAGQYPERVRKLLLVGTFPRFTDELRAAIVRQGRLHEQEPWFEDGLQAYAKRAAREYADDDEFDALYMAAFRFFFALYGEPERAFVERIREHGTRIDRRTLESFNDQVASFDLRPELQHIEAETLIVNGELEASRAGEQELLAGISNARLAIVEGAGHFPWVEQPARFRDAVLPFLGPDP